MKKTFIFLCLIFFVSISNTKAQSNFVGSGIDLQFDGSVGNYVNLGDVFNSLAFPLTIEAWVNLQGYPPIYAGIFSADNDVSKYYGFWFFYTSTGLLRFEFGNAQGSGSQFRRGVVTTEALPLNKWIHVAVVCNSATDMHMYFNGVEKSTVSTDGTSLGTSIIHSSAPASIGRLLTPFDEHNFDGHLDEIRLWNISRTQTNIRDFMCRKLNPGTAGLVGYWTADESYTSDTVNDHTVPAENGTIVGTVTKTTSGAAIGDASKYLYTSSWSAQKITLGSLANDRFSVKSIMGNPFGVQVYRVDAAPYFTSGLGLTPDYYYGVFCAEGNSVAQFKAIYKYNVGNGVVDSVNESSLTLFKREDGSVVNWSDLNASLDTTLNRLSRGNQMSRREYILNAPVNGKFAEEPATSPALSGLSVYPNPANQKISLTLSDAETISAIRIADVTGKIIKESIESKQGQVISIDVSDLNNGIYLISALTSAGWRIGKFEVQK